MCEESSTREEVQTSDKYYQDNASEACRCAHYSVDRPRSSDSTAQRVHVGEPGEKEARDISPDKGEVPRNTSEEKSCDPTGFRDLFLKYEAEQQQE